MAEPENVPDCECPDFCGEFLLGMEPSLQKRVIEVQHSVIRGECLEPFSVCEGLLKEMANLQESDPFLYAMLLKHLSFSLLITSEVETATKLVEQRLDEMNKEDFITLIILGEIYDKRGQYESAISTYQRAEDWANQNGDSLQHAYILTKFATSYWNLGQPERCHEFMDKSRRTFERSSSKEGENLSKESAMLLEKYYKTMGYLNRVNRNHKRCKYYYLKALDVVDKNEFTGIQKMKVLSQIALTYANLRNKYSVHLHGTRALSILDEIFRNSSVQVAMHARQIIQIMTRIGFAYSIVKDLEESLNIGKKTLKIAREYMPAGDAHPAVARLASELCCLCHRLNRPRQSIEFVDIYEKSMKECDYKNDENKRKLYVREVTDALGHYAKSHCLQSNYALAADTYQEAIDINVEVYGEINLRTSKAMRLLGRTYKQWGKYQLAKKHLTRSAEILEKYQPINKILLKEVKEELEEVEFKYKKWCKKQ